MLRIGWLLVVLTVCTLVSQAAGFAITMAGFEVNGVGYAPIRPIADWLGVKCDYYEATRQISLSDLRTSMALTIGSREAKVSDAAVTLPGPALSYDGVSYAPVRVVLESFDSLTGWEPEKRKLTALNKKRLAPLEITFTPTTSNEAMGNETLAGITIGDHPLKAFALWGRPIDSRDSKVIPGARDYYFQIDPEYGISLLVIVKNDGIALVQTLLTGYKPVSALGAYLAPAGSKGGLQLARPAPESYLTRKLPVGEYGIATKEFVLESYTAGELIISACYTAFEKTRGITEITLVRRGFPRESMPVSGPVPVLFTDDQPVTAEPVVAPLVIPAEPAEPAVPAGYDGMSIGGSGRPSTKPVETTTPLPVETTEPVVIKP